MRLLTPLCFDALNFVFLAHMTADGKQVMQGSSVLFTRIQRAKIFFFLKKDDGVNLSPWYQNLCKLAGTMFCKYPDTDVSPLLHYIVNQVLVAFSFLFL